MRQFLTVSIFAGGLVLAAGLANAQPPAPGQGPRDGSVMTGKATGPRDGTGMKNRGTTRNGQGNGPRRGMRTGPQNRTGPGCN